MFPFYIYFCLFIFIRFFNFLVSTTPLITWYWVTRVAEFDFLTENLDSGAVKLVLTQFDFHLSAIFITFCRTCDISM